MFFLYLQIFLTSTSQAIFSFLEFELDKNKLSCKIGFIYLFLYINIHGGMMKQYYFVLFIASISLLLPIQAATIVAGMTLEDSAFADQVLTSSGTWTIYGGSFSAAVTGSDVTTSYYVTSSSATAYADLLFTDNLIQNRTGADLAVFELSGVGSAGQLGCAVTLTINGVKKTYSPVWAQNDVYIAKINLDDFGVAANATISQIRIWGSTAHPDYAAFAAINNVNLPEPSSICLLGFISLAFLYFKKKK